MIKVLKLTFLFSILFSFAYAKQDSVYTKNKTETIINYYNCCGNQIDCNNTLNSEIKNPNDKCNCVKRDFIPTVSTNICCFLWWFLIAIIIVFAFCCCGFCFSKPKQNNDVLNEDSIKKLIESLKANEELLGTKSFKKIIITQNKILIKYYNND